MKRDERLFLVAAGEASHWETMFTRLELACSASAKARYRQFSTLKEILMVSLADPDDRVTVKIQRKKGTNPRRYSSLFLLLALTAILCVEWGSYTIPTLVQCFKYLAHRCGIQ